MGSMSASDPAPLPRLGEVYFDVRGESRSMRLSWYANTGVAVFSIWQGDTCTGTFRLPIGDLPRMIETLRRGPQFGAAGPVSPQGATEPHARPGRHGRPAGRDGPAASSDREGARGGRPADPHERFALRYRDEGAGRVPPGRRGGGLPDEPLTAAYPAERHRGPRAPEG